jgi:hypothetical protein
MSDREWFAPKRYGIGAGLPIAWQGWAVIAGFVMLLGLSGWLFGKHDVRALAIVVPATIGLIVISALTTKGGWHWRWGDDS